MGEAKRRKGHICQVFNIKKIKKDNYGGNTNFYGSPASKPFLTSPCMKSPQGDPSLEGGWEQEAHEGWDRR